MKWYNKEAWISTILTIIVGFLIVLLLGGCKTKEYIKVPEYHTEYVVRKDTVSKTDSVYVKDSVYVFQKGDTVVISKIAYRDRYRNIYKVKLDTIFKHDSIEVPVPCERTLTKGEQRLMTLGRCYIGTLLALLSMLMVVCCFGFAFWYHNKKC